MHRSRMDLSFPLADLIRVCLRSIGRVGKLVIYNQSCDPVSGTFTSLACYGNIMFMSCPDNRTINVTSGLYGQYAHIADYNCTDDCCPPSPRDDCVEDMLTSNPQDLLGIKLLCDDQQSCDFEYQGTLINGCMEGYIADYMQMFYNCLPRE